MSAALEGSKTILVIDDKLETIKLAAKYLTQAGFSVIQAGDGSTGVRYGKEYLPDLVLCDIFMPDVNGFDVLRALRQHEATRLVPFVFLTADQDPSTRREAMEMGADDFLTKPIRRAELLGAINSQLLKSQAWFATQLSQKAEFERIKRRLSLMVAHELKTPLISVVMSHQLMEMQLDELDKEDLRTLLMAMGAGTSRLRHMVEQIVLLTQLETGVIYPGLIAERGERLPLSSLVTEAIDLAFEFDHHRSSAEIQRIPSEGRDTIICDPNSLKHALAELINNAVNFSPAEGVITIEQVEDDDRVWLRVMDQGQGIPSEQLSVALQEFEQLGRERTEQQGIGMGLPLAQKIIAVHDGTLELESDVSGGTQAVVGLPLAP